MEQKASNFERVNKHYETSEQLKQELKAELHRLKEDYKGGIPSEIIHSTSSDTKYKARRAWFQILVSAIGGLIRNFVVMKKYKTGEPLISQGLFDELNAYIKKMTGDESEFTNILLTRQSDIDEADAMIEKILAELEK